jgi:hypothetical protein
MNRIDELNSMIDTYKKDHAIDANKISDGYHTFGELYEHRIALFIALCKVIDNDPQFQYSEVWKSRYHADGSHLPGWFILGIGTEKGDQITYHLPDSKWHEINFGFIRDKAPEFDGHTSNDVLKRLKELL